MRLHRSGDHGPAEALYGRILREVPDHPDALHFYGVLKHQTGRSSEAVALVQRAIRREPAVPGMHNNLGNIFLELGQNDRALRAYEAALALQPAMIDALNNSGVAWRALGRPEEAEAAYRKAIAQDPGYREAWDNLGRLALQLGRTEEAVAAHLRAIELEPANPQTRRFLISAYMATKDSGRALAVVARWLEEDPDDPSARHLLAAVSGENVPDRASDGYVESMFDGFAASFDRTLGQLDYQAPGLVGRALAAACGAPEGRLAILDAGCGTGLCSPYLRPYAKRLVGVDLSGKMLDRAKGRRGYDELHRGELTRFLLDRQGAYDVVVSADTLIYFGHLGAVLRAAAGALSRGGRLVFTVEEETAAGVDLRLNGHGRYSHSRDHVENALADAGFVGASLEAVQLRTESLEPVLGLLVVARKGSAAGGA